MAVIRMTRFSTDPGDSDAMLVRRAELISAVRARFPGLKEARLTRVDDQTWVDLWTWESPEHLDAAVAAAPGLPEAPAAFKLVRDLSEERWELVDAR